MFSVTLAEELVEYDPPEEEKSPLMKLNTRNLKKLHTGELLHLYGKPHVSGEYARAIELTLCKRNWTADGTKIRC